LIALLVFSVTLGGTFVYDDFDVFALDARLRDPAAWGRYWTQSYNGGVDNLYRPLVSMTYAAQWWLHGADRAWPYHLVNWVLHAGVSALVAELSRRLTLSSTVAYFAGLLFAVHPIHVEAVANVVGRAELMCAAGVVGALVLFLHRPFTVSRALAVWLCTAVAVLSKEQGLLAPTLLLVLGLTVRFRPRDAFERRGLLTLAIALIWTLAGYVIFRESILPFAWDRSALDWTINPLVRSAGADRWLVPLAILGRYATLLVAPFRLSPDYGDQVIGETVRWDEPYVYLGFAAIFAWVALLGIALMYRNAPAVFGLVALALSYGLVSNFAFLIGTNFGERLMYLPSAFVVLIVAIGLAKLPQHTAVAATVVLCVLGVARSITYAARWNDRLLFYELSSREQPQSIRLRMLIAHELLTLGRLDEAADVAQRARELLPEYHEVWIQSSDIAAALGRFDEAEAHLREAIRVTPRSGNIAKAAERIERLNRMRATTGATTMPRSAPPSGSR
jgi:hypothetical protein